MAMKQFVAFFMLFCLTFLNVPREWVHDCGHEHVASVNDDESTSSIENESCFVCSFDLDAYQPGSPLIFKVVNKPGVKLTDALIQLLSNDEFDHYSQRGPPLV